MNCGNIGVPTHVYTHHINTVHWVCYTRLHIYPILIACWIFIVLVLVPTLLATQTLSFNTKIVEINYKHDTACLATQTLSFNM